MENIDSCIKVYSGILFDPLNPNIEDIKIEDIAHALSQICRFNGHCNEFYSVAQHSVLVSILSEDHRAGLLHDATEAYLLDIPSPVKKNINGYKEIENNLLTILSKKFNFTYPLPIDVKQADNTMLMLEMQTFFTNGKIFPLTKIKAVQPKEAENIFLNVFNLLDKHPSELNKIFETFKKQMFK